MNGYISVKAWHITISGPTDFNFFVNDFCSLFIEQLFANYADDNSLCVIREQLLDVKYALEAEREKSIRWFEENQNTNS